jgi:hypothetical protein
MLLGEERGVSRRCSRQFRSRELSTRSVDFINYRIDKRSTKPQSLFDNTVEHCADRFGNTPARDVLRMYHDLYRLEL